MWFSTICALSSLLLPQEPVGPAPSAATVGPATPARWSTFWWADYDGDGRDDAFVTVPGRPGRLLRNLGEEGFADVTREAGLADRHGVRQVLWSDVDGDGRLDLLLVSPSGSSALFKNEPGGAFLDVTRDAGLEVADGVLFGEFTDYDGDGDVDLFLAGTASDRFYRNLGRGVFEPLGIELPAPIDPRSPAATPPAPASGSERGSGREALGSTSTSGTASAPAGANQAAGPTLICADTIDDFANPGVCIGASSVPMLGMLYPLSSTFYVDGAGHVGVNTTAPAEALDVSGNVRASGQLVSTATSGAPLAVSSSTLVTGLNADQLDGLDASAFSQLGNSIGSTEIETAAINSTHIAAGAVTTIELATGAVTGADIAIGAVLNSRLAPDCVDGSKVLNQSLTGADIATDSLTAADLAPGSVGASELASGAVTDIDVSTSAAIQGSKITPAFTQTVTTIADLGVGTTTPDVDLHVVGSSLQGSVMIAPNQSGSGSDSDLFLAEDENGTYGMRLRYDGGLNRLDILGRQAADDPTPNFSIARDSGDVQIGNNGAFQGRLTVNATDTGSPAVKILANASNAINASNSWSGGATIYADQNATAGAGIWGVGEERGVYGFSSAASGTGVVGQVNNTNSPADGVLGLTPSPNGVGVNGVSTATSGASFGVRGHSYSSSGYGVYGLSTATTGFTYGVVGTSLSNLGVGVYGRADNTTGTTYGVLGRSASSSGYGVYSLGDMGATGTKSFVQPHPTDPSKEIRFVCLEGNESGTYFRGSARLVGGRAVIDVPEEFRLVSERDGLTVQLTPMGPAQLWVVEKSLERIVVAGSGDVEFDYLVNGVRYGFDEIDLVRENQGYRPHIRGEVYGTQYPPKLRQRLVDNGILNPDFTPNEALAAQLGWELVDPKPVTSETVDRQIEISRTMAATRAQAEAAALEPPATPARDE